MRAFALAKRRRHPGEAAAAFVWVGPQGERVAFVRPPLARMLGEFKLNATRAGVQEFSSSPSVDMEPLFAWRHFFQLRTFVHDRPSGDGRRRRAIGRRKTPVAIDELRRVMDKGAKLKH